MSTGNHELAETVLQVCVVCGTRGCARAYRARVHVLRERERERVVRVRGGGRVACPRHPAPGAHVRDFPPPPHRHHHVHPTPVHRQTANITTANGTLSVCFDHRRQKFSIPRFCWCTPVNIRAGVVDELSGKADEAVEAQPLPVSVRIAFTVRCCNVQTRTCWPVLSRGRRGRRRGHAQQHLCWRRVYDVPRVVMLTWRACCVWVPRIQEVLLKFDLTTTSTIADLKQVVNDKLAEKVAVRAPTPAQRPPPPPTRRPPLHTRVHPQPRSLC